MQLGFKKFSISEGESVDYILSDGESINIKYVLINNVTAEEYVNVLDLLLIDREDNIDYKITDCTRCGIIDFVQGDILIPRGFGLKLSARKSLQVKLVYSII